MSEAMPFDPPLHVGRPNIGDTSKFAQLTASIFERQWLSNEGPTLLEFESRLRQVVPAKHVIPVVNGTLALELVAHGLGLTGEVIVPSFTFVATVHALEMRGLTPVFADIDPETHNIDPQSVRRLIGPDTSGILAVHLWGRPAPVRELEALADEYGIKLFFDAAHAFAVRSSDGNIGTNGSAEVFSFHATKFFNSIEGGAIATNDDELASMLRGSRNFGFSGEDRVTQLGTNAKMNEICAAMGLVNLDSLQDVLATNRTNYAAYRDELTDVDGVMLHEVAPAGTDGNYQYVVLKVADGRRERVIEALRAQNVLARRYFWPGCHRMEPYRSRHVKGADNLKHTERVSEQVVVLPTGPQVGRSSISRIGEIVRTALS